MSKLDTLIPQYAENKQLLDDYKKICEKENSEIKELIKEGSYETNGYKATVTVQHRESFNEDKLLDVLQKDRIYRDLGIIKTKEYVDMDALESVIYRKMLSGKQLMDIDKCRNSKEVVTLKVSRIKKENK